MGNGSKDLKAFRQATKRSTAAMRRLEQLVAAPALKPQKVARASWDAMRAVGLLWEAAARLSER
jgi:hypothetical protein